MSAPPEPLWLRSYPPHVDWRMDAVNKPVHRIFEEVAQAQPQAPCLDFLGRRYSYGEVNDLVCHFAKGLQHIGIKKGDRVGLCLPNCPYYVIAYYAALKIGATLVNFNILYTEAEIEQQIRDSGISLMVTADLKLIYNKVKQCLLATSLEKIIFCSMADVLPAFKKVLFNLLQFKQLVRIKKDDFNLSFNELLGHGNQSEPVEIDPMLDIALFQYTGGTSGQPKAAMLTHSNIVTNAKQVSIWLNSGAQKIGASESTESQGQRKFLAVLPFFHVFSMTAVMNMGVLNGAELILLPRFDLKSTLKAIENKQVTVLAGVPAIFNSINNYEKLNHYDLSSIKVCISGGAALPQTVRQHFMNKSQCAFVEGYGLSESSPVLTCNPAHSGGKAGSIGLPLPGTEIEIRSLEDVEKIEAIGDKGEILARGPQVMQGYWQREQENQDTLLQGGWLRTGDIGHMDEDGFVYLTDRLKDVIIVNGYKVYPRIIEDALYQHPEVDEVIALGLPDEKSGEAAYAYVKLITGSKLTESDLMRISKEVLNPIERPEKIEIRSELPKTLIGKPSKKLLLEEELRKRKSS